MSTLLLVLEVFFYFSYIVLATFLLCRQKNCWTRIIIFLFALLGAWVLHYTAGIVLLTLALLAIPATLACVAILLVTTPEGDER